MNKNIRTYLAEQAAALHAGHIAGEALIPLLGKDDAIRVGIDPVLGGKAKTALWHAVEAIATVTEESLTAGFVLWGQRVFAEYVAQSDNDWLKTHVLPAILDGTKAGATGLSNAMKYLSGIETLQVRATLEAEHVVLDGELPWVSNLAPDNFIVAAMAQTTTGKNIIVAIPSEAAGLTRSQDLDLIGLQASQTAALRLNQVRLPRHWIIHEDASAFLPVIRPRFLLLQCGLALGLAYRALKEVNAALGHQQRAQRLLSEQVNHTWDRFRALKDLLIQASHTDQISVAFSKNLFELRIALTKLSVDAVFLELQAQGGKAYFKQSLLSRHLTEVAFLPVVTPSLMHLEIELARYRQTEQQRLTEESTV